MRKSGGIVILAWALSHACSASAATLTGVFVDPLTNPASVVSGVGNNVLRFGTPAPGETFPSILRFDPVDGEIAEVKGQTFVGGVVGFRNGTINTNTGIAGVKLEATTVSDNPEFDQVLREWIFLSNTNNLETNTPEQNADVFYWGDRPELGGFRVLEGATGFVQALFEFNSLDLIGFGEILTPDVAFLTDSPFTPVDDDFTIAPVPLPAGLPLAIAAFGMLGAAGLRRARPA